MQCHLDDEVDTRSYVTFDMNAVRSQHGSSAASPPALVPPLPSAIPASAKPVPTASAIDQKVSDGAKRKQADDLAVARAQAKAIEARAARSAEDSGPRQELNISYEARRKRAYDLAVANAQARAIEARAARIAAGSGPQQTLNMSFEARRKRAYDLAYSNAIKRAYDAALKRAYAARDARVKAAAPQRAQEEAPEREAAQKVKLKSKKHTGTNGHGASNAKQSSSPPNQHGPLSPKCVKEIKKLCKVPSDCDNCIPGHRWNFINAGCPEKKELVLDFCKDLGDRSPATTPAAPQAVTTSTTTVERQEQKERATSITRAFIRAQKDLAQKEPTRQQEARSTPQEKKAEAPSTSQEKKADNVPVGVGTELEAHAVRKGACCRRNNYHALRVKPTTTTFKNPQNFESCEKECLAHQTCRFFSSSAKFQDCFMCVSCDKFDFSLTSKDWYQSKQLRP